ncbi:hypothetical protein [Acanthopleuribacter pedis]|uniref:Uncharacterized protein n=1 Tax=Acanthopleuribacter pedis TaxID=442870 RepID=A0A8J7U2W7_9BACT|nr:hypothetical protein [Acanthopleuribacter pedis]MBO1319743.1 hypothetical protein [Acanthopleuribacter pedis]
MPWRRVGNQVAPFLFAGVSCLLLVALFVQGKLGLYTPRVGFIDSAMNQEIRDVLPRDRVTLVITRDMCQGKNSVTLEDLVRYLGLEQATLACSLEVEQPSLFLSPGVKRPSNRGAKVRKRVGEKVTLCLN